ncbi:hypothetical protein AB0H88_17505 [Nonomuraea sp. NPDC050680]
MRAFVAARRSGIEAKSLADAREEGPDLVNLPTGRRWIYLAVSRS